MRLSHQVALATLSKTVKHVSVFALSIILARSLSTEDYGTYLQVQLVVSTLLYLAIFGVPHSIYYFLPRTRQPRLLIGVSALVLNLFGLALALGVYFSIEKISDVLSNPDLVGLAALTAVMLLLQVPIKLFEPAMIAAKRVGTFVLLNGSFNLLFFFPIAVPALLGWSVAEILTSMMAFYAVQYVAIMLTLITVTLKLVGREDGESYSFRAQVVYSLPIGLSGAVGEIGRQADKVVVGSFFDPSQYAIYTRGAMEIPLLNVISNSLHNIMMPRFVEAYRDGDTERLLQSWQSAIRLMAAFVYPACAFFIGVGDLLIPFLYSDRFADAGVIFQIYMMTLLVRVTTGDAVIRAIGRTEVLFKLSVLAIVTNIVLTVALIRVIGIIGAPVATVLTSYLMVVIYVRVVGGMLGIQFSRVFPWLSLAKTLGIAIVAIVFASVVRGLELTRPSMLLGVFCAFAVIYWALFKKVRILGAGERDAVASLLPRQLRWLV